MYKIITKPIQAFCRKKCHTVLWFLLIAIHSFGQPAFDKVQFFIDESPLFVQLSTDVSNLTSGKIKDNKQEALFTCLLPDSSSVTEPIQVNARGNVRRQICYMPPLRLNFKSEKAPRLSCLNNLKLVVCCRDNNDFQQLLFREFLVYKMYQLLTDKSFRVRLVQLTCEDNRGKKKPSTQYAFFVEDVDDLAKRNKCKELNDVKIFTESTDREQMTMLALFEYMIGNTDWSIPNNHNIKLVKLKKNDTAKAYPIPYDFDYAGIVNAQYAIPDPNLDIEKVTQRLYRGFPRTMEELQAAIQIFNAQRDSIYSLVSNFELLDGRNKKEMINYLDGFYKQINDEREVEYWFIKQARKQ